MVSILIVNWNTKELLLNCIDSIYKNTSDIQFEIIVVDNNSVDESVNAVKSNYPQIKLIISDKNLGFAGGNNLGLPHCEGEHILLLNPDTLVHPESIKKMVDVLNSHPDYACIGPALIGTDEKLQISAFGLYPGVREAFFHAVRIWKLAPNSDAAKSFLLSSGNGNLIETAHILGACMLFNADILRTLKGFDEDFFLFLEETDLCYRAKKLGYKIGYFNGVSITHVGEQSMQKILQKTGGLYIRSYNLYCKKRAMGLLSRVLVNISLCIGVIIESILGLVKYKSPKRALSSLTAIIYGYLIKP